MAVSTRKNRADKINIYIRLDIQDESDPSFAVYFQDVVLTGLPLSIGSTDITFNLMTGVCRT